MVLTNSVVRVVRAVSGQNKEEMSTFISIWKDARVQSQQGMTIVQPQCVGMDEKGNVAQRPNFVQNTRHNHRSQQGRK